MATTFIPDEQMQTGDAAVEHVDVLIVGAGISGIGIAWNLQQDMPEKSWAIVEARDAIGGTWDLFRYPGVRSDSDLYTFGYAFRPWKGNSIATGAAILGYLHDVVRDSGIDGKIRFRQKVLAADWSSNDARWTVSLLRQDTGQRLRITCSWLMMAAGYYDFEQGYSPDFPGREDFEKAGGQVIHPQRWPRDLDYSGKRVVVIGSGATAVTLVPAMAERAEHVTMLQRSPTYVITAPSVDRLALLAQKLLPDGLAHRLTRRKNIALQRVTWRLFRRFPKVGSRLLRYLAARQLPAGYPTDQHFQPQYDPWDQRLCASPDGDLFKAISDGRAAVATDQIDTFTAAGIRLQGGRELAADIIVTATGLNLQPLGGIALTTDGQPVDVAETVAYRGMMLSGIPNLMFVFGYFFSSWTLKVDLLFSYYARLIAYMEKRGFDSCCPHFVGSPEATEPMMSLKSNYVRRATDRMPRQGPAFPWRSTGEYIEDAELVRNGQIDDPGLHFSARPN